MFFFKKKPQIILPSFLSFFAYTLWSIGDALIKLAGEHGSTPFLAMGFVGFGSALALVIAASAQKRMGDLKARKPLLVFLRGIFAVVSSLCFYTAYTNLMLSEAYLVEFLAPFLICLGASWLMKEPLSMLKMILVILGFLGCVTAIAPEFVQALSLKERGGAVVWGYAAAIIGTVSFVIVQLMSRTMVKTETSDSILLIALLMIGVTGLAGTRLSFDAVRPMAYAYLAVVPVLNLFAAMAMLKAHKTGAATTVSLFHYWQLVTGAIMGYYIWHALPTPHFMAGATLVVLSGLWMIRADRQEKKVLACAV